VKKSAVYSLSSLHLAPVMKTLAMKRWGLLWEAAVVAAAVVAAIN
jgi:hypothetical protein